MRTTVIILLLLLTGMFLEGELAGIEFAYSCHNCSMKFKGYVVQGGPGDAPREEKVEFAGARTRFILPTQTLEEEVQEEITEKTKGVTIIDASPKIPKHLPAYKCVICGTIVAKDKECPSCENN